MAEELLQRMHELVETHQPTKGWNARALQMFQDTIAWWSARPPSAITGRGRSANQDVGTPPEFIRVVQEFIGTIQFDLAGSEVNHVHPRYLTKEDDALAPTTRWPKYKPDLEVAGWPQIGACWRRLKNLLWLNPEYANIAPWLARCQEEMERGRHIAVLIPASIGSRWWKKWVEDTWTEDGHGPRWLSLGRMKFVGQKQGAPRDMALLIYSDTWSPELVNKDAAKYLALPSNTFFQTDRAYLGNWDWKAFLAELTGNPHN